MRVSTQEKVLRNIDRNTCCTNEALVAADLGMSIEAVTRHVKKLLADGLVERAWDGKALETSIEGKRYLVETDVLRRKLVIR